MSVELNSKQEPFVNEHLEKVAVELSKLQEDLEAEGIKPVQGWKRPSEFRVVKGVNSICSDHCWDLIPEPPPR